MKNRVPKYPGRIKLKDVLTGEERLYDMTRADEPTEDGTPINKETLLTDQTADRYGLDEDGTPDDAFAFLGNYTEWRWNRRTVKWTENQGEETSVYYSPSSSSQNVVSASYSDAISFDPSTGSVSLVSPSSMISNANNVYENMTPLKGKYLKLKDDNVYFAGDNYEIEVTHYGGGGISIYIKGLLPISANKSTGPWEEVRASTDDAYPDSGISGGYEYEAQGMPLEKAAALSPGGGSGGGSGESWKVGTGLKLSGNVLSVDTATSVATGGDKPVTAAAVKTALDGLTPSPGGSGPVLVPATIKFTLADSGSTTYPQGSTQIWLLYDGIRFWLPGDATFVFSSAVKLASFSVTVAPSTGYEWNEPVGSGDVLSVIQTMYTSSYVTDRPNRISVTFAGTGATRTYPLLSNHPYTDAVTICAGIMGAGKVVDA